MSQCDDMRIWTIGHSSHPLEHFLSLLRQHQIEVLVDVRRFPGSRTFPHFRRENLERELAAVGIEYRWLEDLGGRRSSAVGSGPSPNRGWRNKSFRNYADYMMTVEFRAACDDLLRIALSRRTAIMCSESVFWRCHRRLISDYVTALGGMVEHIFPNGQAKPHTLTERAVIEEGEPRLLIYPSSG